MHTRFRTVAPLIPAGADLDAAIEFYERRLGFRVTYRATGGAGIERGDVAFHLVRNDNQVWADNASFSIGVDDLDALYEEYRELPLRLKPPEMKAWGRREVHMIVPPGVCFQFFEADRDGRPDD